MVFGVFVTVAALSLATAGPDPRPRRAVRKAPVHATRGTEALGPDPAGAYSLRARRRFAAYLRLRLLEMREAGLERAADVIERRLPIDTLVHDAARPRPGH